ncbi:MAG: hypothetical protein JXB49_08925 [Bacteroidales bacterium]|nr:hypothetical protein [Bacteroidales bacterium]
MKNIDKIREEIIFQIYREINRRKDEANYIPERQETNIPGDLLVSLAGKLSLMSSSQMLSLYEQTLWPMIRDTLKIESPGALVNGKYTLYIDQTRKLLEESSEIKFYGRSEKLLDRKHLMILLMLISPVFSTSRPDLTAKEYSQEMVQLKENPEVMSELQKWVDDCISIFINRLESGFFLTGIEVLFPLNGNSAARTLWHEGLLKDWDLFLTRPEHVEKLEPLKKTFREIISELPVSLSGPWFESIRMLIHESSDDVKDDEIPDIKIEDDLSQDIYIMQLLLLEDFLKTEFKEADWNLAFDMNRSFIIVSLNQEYQFGVWFPENEEDSLTLSAEVSQFIDTIFTAKTIAVSDSQEYESDDTAIFTIIFTGYWKEHLWTGDQTDSQYTADSELVVNCNQFSGDHNEIVKFIQNDFLNKV